jgi:tetratricopeptide (TPR) repeat protein
MFDVSCGMLGLLLALLLGCARVSLAASPASPAAEFDQANQLYGQGKYAEAVGKYEELLRAHTVSPATYFNLGNAFFKSGEIGRALASYRQAERMAPRDPDLRANLQFVRNQVQAPTLLPGRWERWLRTLTLNEWTFLASGALWCWLLTLTLAQLRPAWRQSLRSAKLFTGIATVALGLCLGSAVLNSSNRSAIVISHQAVVHNGPLDESPTAFEVHDGAELNVLDAKNDWLQVSAGPRRVGWLKRTELLVLP